jgi:transposase
MRSDEQVGEQTQSEALGIDVSKAKLDVALLRDGKLKHRSFDNRASGFDLLLTWLDERGVDRDALHVCMEATGPYSEACATHLCDAGLRVSVVNPARVKGFAQSELSRNKTDQADAALIARFCAAMRPEPWQAPTPELRKLRALIERLQALQDNAQQERNRLAVCDAAIRVNIEAHLTFLLDAIAALEREIDDHVDHHPDLRERAKLLSSIDGIGTLTASKVLAYAGHVDRFASAKAFSAFIGVAPRQRRSGTTLQRTMMGKGGSNALRHALYMPAMVALRFNKTVAALGERLAARGMAKKAIIGAAMHKLAHLIYGVLKTGQPFRTDWANTSSRQQPTA